MSLLLRMVSPFFGQFWTNEPIRFKGHVSGGRTWPVSANKALGDLFGLNRCNDPSSSASNKMLAFLILQLPFFWLPHSGFIRSAFPARGFPTLVWFLGIIMCRSGYLPEIEHFYDSGDQIFFRLKRLVFWEAPFFIMPIAFIGPRKSSKYLIPPLFLRCSCVLKRLK